MKQQSRNRHALKHDISRVKDALSLTAQDLRLQARDSLDNARDRFKDKTSDLTKYSKKMFLKEPAKIVGITALAAFILGYAINRKKRARYNSHR